MVELNGESFSLNRFLSNGGKGHITIVDEGFDRPAEPLWDRFLAQLFKLGENVAEQAQSVADAVDILSNSSLSVTSASIGTGPLTLAAETGKSFIAGQYIKIAYSLSPIDTYMVGVVTDYNSLTGALDVEVIAVEGSGTFASWAISNSRNPFVTTYRTGFVSGQVTNHQLAIGATAAASRVESFNVWLGTGTASVQLYNSPTQSIGDGAALGAGLSVSSSLQSQTFSAANETIAGQPNYILAEITDATSAQDLFYEATITQQVRV